MDRRHFLARRLRELLGERLDDVAAMARQDCQEMRGWEEPAHVRAVLGKTFRDLDAAEQMSTRDSATATQESSHGIGSLLEAGAVGLEKIALDRAVECTADEMLGLECVLNLYVRPAILVSQDRMGAVPPCWKVLDDRRHDLETAQRAVGRIELLGHPEFAWAGTGFLVGEHCVLTTRRTTEAFAELRGGSWTFRPGITAWMDYRSHQQPAAEAGYRVRGVLGIHDRYDLSLLEVEHPEAGINPPASPLVVSQPLSNWNRRPMYLVGYPIRDARRREPEPLATIFQDSYNVKRVCPGMLLESIRFEDLELVRHDCGLLGRMAGAALVDLETHHVVGLHMTGCYLEPSTAVPLWLLRDDPLFRDSGIAFAMANPGEVDRATQQVERLALSPYWIEVRDSLAALYKRAYG